MKRFVLMLSFIVGFLVIPVAVTFAASIVGEQVFNQDGIEVYFYSLAALAGAVLPVTQFIKKLLNSSGNWTRYISWVVAIGLAFLGWWLNLGMLEGLKVVWVVVYGIAAGLVSNSVVDAVFVEMILKILTLGTLHI